MREQDMIEGGYPLKRLGAGGATTVWLYLLEQEPENALR